ncbi:MAG: hypothetical protein BGN88_00835 [Clostridiales bacterium 43-6]|nr:MAG: hypothetical protein BGN88_00835 [Clostridiales bacterium 43-6]
MSEQKEFLTYKEKPLVRSGNTLYYGDMSDKYVIMLQINSTKTVNNLLVADDVTVQLLLTDPDVSARNKVVKKSEKKGLYEAMDIGAIWLQRALNDK